MPNSTDDATQQPAIHETRCRTHRRVTVLSYEWQIANFSLCSEATGEALTSPTFCAGPGDQLRWRLNIYPKGESVGSMHYVSLFLMLDSTGRDDYNVRASFTFSLLNAQRQEIHSLKTITHQFHERSPSKGYIKFIAQDLISDPAEGLLPNDQLTVHCQVTIVGKPESESATSELSAPATLRIPDCRLSEDHRRLLDHGQHSDVLLCPRGGAELPAHRAILAARSPVFQAMFQRDTTESLSRRVVLDDVDAETMHEVLQFLYSGQSPRLNQMSHQMLPVADKYLLDRLKAMCEDSMAKALTLENACDWLSLADMHSAGQLHQSALNFILSNADGIAGSAGLERLLSGDRPNLARDVFRALSEQVALPPLMKRPRTN